MSLVEIRSNTDHTDKMESRLATFGLPTTSCAGLGEALRIAIEIASITWQEAAFSCGRFDKVMSEAIGDNKA